MTDPTQAASATPLAEGDRAPDFRLPRDGGGDVALADMAGRATVLYFYPRDDTSGCTREALDFSAASAAFQAAGAVVLGVSKDSVAAHDRFRDKHGLTVTLLSDAEGDVCERYGVWVEKSMYGRRFLGVERATFLIDGAGIIRRVWRKVKAPGHAVAVLEAARAMEGE